MSDLIRMIKEASIYQIVVWGILILITLAAILPPDIFFFKVVSKYLVQIMFSFLTLGLLFLFFSDERSMMLSFICCGVLCLFLRTRSPFFAVPQVSENFSVATFNLALSDDGYDTTILTIIDADADLIALQELTPDWHNYLQNNAALKKLYPFDTSIVRLDFHGLAIFSKYRFASIDTFHFREIPNIIGSIAHDSLSQPVCFISSHTTPPVNTNAYERIDSHLQVVAQRALELRKPVLVMGDFQVMPWSSEVVRFKTKGVLLDSRRDMSLTYLPYDHIFYSKELECTDFKSIGTKNTTHLGVMGEFQLAKQVAGNN